MAKCVFRKVTVNGRQVLAPANKESERVLAKYADRESLMCEVKKPRNIAFHSKWFALLHTVYDNQERYDSFERFRADILIRLGKCDTIISKEGAVGYIPKSVSFAKMDGHEFQDLWDATCTLMCEQIIPGLDRADLEREIGEFLT